MRILHLHSGNLYGGVETVLVTLARGRDLCPEMESHFALCFEGRLSQELEAAAPVYFLGDVRISRPWTMRRACRGLNDLLRENPFDLVLCHSLWSHLIFGSVVRSVGLPLVLWRHDATDGRHWLERWAGRTRPDLVLCNSHFTANTLPDLYPHVPTEVVYYPMAPPESGYSDADRVTLRSEFNTSEKEIVIIQVSRIEKWKGHALVLEALGLLKEMRWTYWLAGGAQRPQEFRYLQYLKEMTFRFGIKERIHFLGERRDVPGLLRAADIFCQPNTGPEPFGITFIEALYAELPIVTTAIGGAREIIDDSCGVLVQPNNPQALASSLQRLILDPALRARLGARGPARAHKLCDPKGQITKVAEVLTRVIKGIPAADKTLPQDRCF